MYAKLSLILLLLVWCCSAVVGKHFCPPKCVCYRTLVRCIHAKLKRVPMVELSTTVFDLRFNQISEIHPGDLANLTNLHTLLLSNNRISRLQANTFASLSELKRLHLQKNRISEVHADALLDLDSLEHLYLYSNRISDLMVETFRDLPMLKRLFLQRNNIRRLVKGLFSKFHNLNMLKLEQNELMCDCSMAWLAEYLHAHKHLEAHSEVKCTTPAAVSGKRVRDLGMKEFSCRMPHIMEDPHDQVVELGKTAYLRCDADGQPSPRIRWYHNDNEVLPNGKHFSILEDGTLMIEETSDQEEGVFYCMAGNVVGDAKSREARVRTRRQAPDVLVRFIKRPHDKTVMEGSRVEFLCQAASGRQQPLMRWRKDNVRMPPDERIAVSQTGTLTITNVIATDDGEYQCLAFSEHGVLTASARLTVRVPPRFIHKPTSTRVIEGSPLTLMCKAVGSPQPVILWSKDRQAILGDNNVELINIGQVLRFIKVRASDSGLYTCTAKNLAGRSTITVDVTVVETSPPSVTVETTHVSEKEGETAKLKCEVTGRPAPKFTWLLGSTQVPNVGRYRQIGELLYIRDLRTDDWGLYKCIGKNPYGMASATVLVTVLNRAIEDVKPIEVNRSVIEAEKEVNKAIEDTLKRLNDPNRSAADLLARFRMPSHEALQLSKAALIYERALEIIHEKIRKMGKVKGSKTDFSHATVISRRRLAIIANFSGCEQHREEVRCNDICFHYKYRTWNGTCNNMNRPMWGSSLTPFNRLLKPAYENGLNSPIGWNKGHLYNGHPKPSARLVSLELAATKEITPDPKYSSMLMQWGQFLDHDLDFTPQALADSRFSDGRFCNETCENSNACFPIPIDRKRDPRINKPCLGFTRSIATCGSGMTSLLFNTVAHREQINEITSFVDASNVYGSSEEVARALRDFSPNEGEMRTSSPLPPPSKPLLPFNFDAPMDCQIDPNTAHIPCFQAGDFRANEQLGLIAMHTVWLREHNRIAKELSKLNPLWGGDMIYHETRKIIGAMMQHISYQHFLPKVLGPIGMQRLGRYYGYDPNINPSVVNAFATAAYRFGHTLINPIMHRLNKEFLPTIQGNLPLHKAFFAPFRIVEEGGVDPILRGLFGTPVKKTIPQQPVNEELTEKLFKLAHSVALDLAALNIQRGRDHGLPDYITWRGYCKLSQAQSFDDLTADIPDELIRNKMRKIYGHPRNVDLWIGGLMERKVEDAMVGPTLLCILVEQFKRLRNGDRFWYENPGMFTEKQLNQIRQSSLARVMCDNGDDIDRVQRDVFLNAPYPNGYKACEEIPVMNLTAWQDCCDTCSAESSNPRLYKRASEKYMSIVQQDNPKSSSDLDMVSHAAGGHTVFKKKTPENSVHTDTENARKKSKCIDPEMETHEHGRIWIVKKCTQCRCDDGTVYCKVLENCDK